MTSVAPPEDEATSRKRNVSIKNSIRFKFSTSIVFNKNTTTKNTRYDKMLHRLRVIMFEEVTNVKKLSLIHI